LAATPLSVSWYATAPAGALEYQPYLNPPPRYDFHTYLRPFHAHCAQRAMEIAQRLQKGTACNKRPTS
jgi:hypothetical protein